MEISKQHFLEIIKDHEKILFKVSNAYCAEPEDRKDIVQEMIIQLWKSRNNYNPKYKLSTWVYRIALNVAISHYRKAYRRKESAIELNENLINISDNESGNMEEDNLLLLQKFIAELDKLNKALILLYLEDYSYREIAEMLGISETNVATKINRLKKRLKERFEKTLTIKKKEQRKKKK